MLTYGDEIGMPGDFGEDGRRPMPWAARGSDPARWDEATYAAYRTLIRARRSTPALHSGGMRWLHSQDDALVFLREHPEGTALVHLARAAHDPVRLPAAGLPGVGEGQPLVGTPPQTTQCRCCWRRQDLGCGCGCGSHRCPTGPEAKRRVVPG